MHFLLMTPPHTHFGPGEGELASLEAGAGILRLASFKENASSERAYGPFPGLEHYELAEGLGRLV